MSQVTALWQWRFVLPWLLGAPPLRQFFMVKVVVAVAVVAASIA
jgi:hypothetical protein